MFPSWRKNLKWTVCFHRIKGCTWFRNVGCQVRFLHDIIFIGCIIYCTVQWERQQQTIVCKDTLSQLSSSEMATNSRSYLLTTRHATQHFRWWDTEHNLTTSYFCVHVVQIRDMRCVDECHLDVPVTWVIFLPLDLQPSHS